jgi:threonine/homoserine/homoserine lactone efflux protein
VTDLSSSWAALLVLGAGHGINPAMGWLFAVALGLQRGSRRAVWSALGPLALGHAVAMALTIAVAAAVGLVLPPSLLKWLVAAGCSSPSAFTA